jgi:hypothetical protein
MTGTVAGAYAGVRLAAGVRPSLEEEFSFLRIPSLPLGAWEAHKQALLAEGSARWRGARILLELVSLFLPFNRAARMMTAFWAPLLLAILWLATLVGIAYHGVELLWSGQLIGGVFFAPFVAIALLAPMTEKESLQTRSARWLRARVDARGVSNADDSNLRVPPHLLRRLNRAQEIPGVRVELEYLGLDPALIAVRGHLFWREEVLIGAWGTGNPALDDA